VVVIVLGGVWITSGRNPFVGGGPLGGEEGDPRAHFDPLGQHALAHHKLHHGVDLEKKEALKDYFEAGDHEDNYLNPDAESGHAIAHPHGKKICASGCAQDQHPTPPLPKAEFEKLMAQFAKEPMSEDSKALQSLLFYGRQSLRYLDQLGDQQLDTLLDAERAAFLRKQLECTHVYVELRMVDEHGVVRLWNKPARVPLDIRYGFDYQTTDYQEIEESTGTVKRVGLNHLWQRI
jgi:hypothetical protein